MSKSECVMIFEECIECMLAVIYHTEGAFDFAITNLDLFHGVYDTTFSFTDDRKKLRDHAFSALYARPLIQKFKDRNDSDISDMEDLTNAAENLVYPIKKEKCRLERNKKGSVIYKNANLF